MMGESGKIKKKIVRYTLSSDDMHWQRVDLHPALKRIYRHRGIDSPDELTFNLSALLPFHLLKDIDKAAQLLRDAIKNQKHICIVGDYDVDGATSTALMVLVLRAYGATSVSYRIPDRIDDGYGLSSAIVQEALLQHVDLIVTVDNGIASISGVETANAVGIPVIVTDHHLVGEQLPNAAAIVNPNQNDDLFPSKHLAGVGVAFYLLLALRATLREDNWFVEQQLTEPKLADYLDLVALGTVADLVTMDHNNRILVHQGLKRIQSGRCRPGIVALSQVANRSLETMTTSDLSYAISPRLNAAGRLDNMTVSVACLLTDDLSEARQIALQLNTFNEERKVIEENMRSEAVQNIKKLDLHLQSGSNGLCLLQDDWHEGVIGILASKIKDQHHCPAVIFAKHDQTFLKGSARSIPGVHIRDVFHAIATEYPGLIVRFGGHAAAAGLTIQRDKYALFSRLFREEVERRLSGQTIVDNIMSDGELGEEDFCLVVADLLQYAAPWGQNFSMPLFDGKFRVLEQRLLAQKHLKMTLKMGDRCIEAIAFNVDTNVWPDHRCDFVQLAYRLTSDSYMGRKKVKLIVEYMEPI